MPQRFSFDTSARSVNDAAKTAVFRINSPSIDSDNEVVLPSGCDLTKFANHAPVLDSHDYSSVDSLIGKVVGIEKSDDYIDATVQFAADVPGNVKAQNAYGAVKAGFPIACSVGFVPITVLRPVQGKPYNDLLKTLDLPSGARPSAIFVKWQLRELSLCVIGANPDAVVKSGAPKPEPSITQSQSMSRQKFLEKLSASTRGSGTTAAEMEQHTVNLSGTEFTALANRIEAALAFSQRGKKSSADRIDTLLSDPLTRKSINAAVRVASNSPLCQIDTDGNQAFKLWTKSEMFGTNLATSIFPTDISRTILSTALEYGAFGDLGVQIASNQQTQFAQMSTPPDAWFITPTSGMGVATYTPDASLAGASKLERMNTLACLLPISNEWLADAGVDISQTFMLLFPQALAKRLDYGCMQGNGVDDQINGLQIGIFQSAAEETNAANGNTTLAQLQREDFLAAVGTVNPAALQRPCRWFLNPAFIPTLMTVAEGKGTRYLLKTPAETNDGEWHLVGYPVTWAAQAPSATAPGSTIGAFGNPETYIVAIREELELMTSKTGPSFSANVSNVRALARAKADMRDATHWALLNLAAQ